MKLIRNNKGKIDLFVLNTFLILLAVAFLMLFIFNYGKW